MCDNGDMLAEYTTHHLSYPPAYNYHLKQAYCNQHEIANTGTLYCSIAQKRGFRSFMSDTIRCTSPGNTERLRYIAGGRAFPGCIAGGAGSRSNRSNDPSCATPRDLFRNYYFDGNERQRRVSWRLGDRSGLDDRGGGNAGQEGCAAPDRRQGAIASILDGVHELSEVAETLRSKSYETTRDQLTGYRLSTLDNTDVAKFIAERGSQGPFGAWLPPVPPTSTPMKRKSHEAGATPPSSATPTAVRPSVGQQQRYEGVVDSAVKGYSSPPIQCPTKVFTVDDHGKISRVVVTSAAAKRATTLELSGTTASARLLCPTANWACCCCLRDNHPSDVVCVSCGVADWSRSADVPVKLRPPYTEDRDIWLSSKHRQFGDVEAYPTTPDGGSVLGPLGFVDDVDVSRLGDRAIKVARRGEREVTVQELEAKVGMSLRSTSQGETLVDADEWVDRRGTSGGSSSTAFNEAELLTERSVSDGTGRQTQCRHCGSVAKAPVVSFAVCSKADVVSDCRGFADGIIRSMRDVNRQIRVRSAVADLQLTADWYDAGEEEQTRVV